MPGHRLASLAAALSLVGCSTLISSTTPTTQPEGEIDWIERLEFVITERSGVDIVDLKEAEEELMRRCMEQRGFQYVATSRQRFLDGAPSRVAEFEFHRRIQIGFLGENPGEGYGMLSHRLAAVGSMGQISTDHAGFLRLDAATRRAYGVAAAGSEESSFEALTLMDGATVGMGTDGCRALALSEMYGDIEKYAVAAFTEGNLRTLVLWDGMNDPAYLEGQTLWSECMASHGYEKKPRIDLIAPLAELYAGPEILDMDAPLPEEIRMATFDTECAAESGFDAVASAILALYAERRLTENVEILDHLKRVRLEALARLGDFR